MAKRKGKNMKRSKDTSTKNSEVSFSVSKKQIKNLAEEIAEELNDLISDSLPEIAGAVFDRNEIPGEATMDLDSEIEELSIKLLIKRIK